MPRHKQPEGVDRGLDFLLVFGTSSDDEQASSEERVQQMHSERVLLHHVKYSVTCR